MENKQKIMIIAIIIIAIIAIIGVTLAYFTDSTTTTANINTGNLSIKVTEDLTPITNWNPGDTNTISFRYVADGSKSAITRYRLKLSFTDENLIQEIANGKNLLVNLQDGEGTSISLTKVSDGQYVTNWIVNESILNGQAEKDGQDSLQGSYQIGLAIAADNIYSEVDFSVMAEIEAVQARNTVLDAKGNSKGLTLEEIAAIFTDEETVARTQTGELVKAK